MSCGNKSSGLAGTTLQRPFLISLGGWATPGARAQHSSIDEALEDAAEDGTRSILDIQEVGHEPDFCVAAPLPQDDLEALYGTAQPTRQMIEQNMDFLENVERGHCVYITVYKDGSPKELFFAGYSFD